jgi:hypothetical protein
MARNDGVLSLNPFTLAIKILTTWRLWRSQAFSIIVPVASSTSARH